MPIPKFGSATGSLVITGGGAIRGVTIGSPSPRGLWNTSHDNDVVEWDRDAFARFISADKTVLWQTRIQCPQRSNLLPEQNHSQDCCVCDGRGWIVAKSETINVQMTSFSEDETRAAQGWWTPGTVSVTAMPEYRLSLHDRLIVTAGAIRYDELLLRRCNSDYDIPRFNVLDSSELAGGEKSVVALVWSDRGKQAHTFIQDTDFVVDTGKIRWLTHNRVDVGDIYSIAYYCRPQYIVTDMPHILRTRYFGFGNTGNKATPYEYPVQVAAKLETQIREMGRETTFHNYTDPLK